MKKNIHDLERIGRIIVGFALVSQVFWGFQNIWFLFGIVPILTGVTGWCSPYAILGISTCSSSCVVKTKEP